MKKLDQSDLEIVSSFMSEIRNIKKLQNPNTKTNPTNTKNQNQINILKKVSIKNTLK